MSAVKRYNGIAHDQLVSKNVEKEINAEKREEICRTLVKTYTLVPRTTEQLWDKVARSLHQFSLAEFELTLQMLRDEEIISWSNGRWWNRETHRAKLHATGGLKPP